MEKNVVLKVDGMSCQHCVNAIEGTLKELGVKGHVNLSAGEVEVVYDDAKLTIAAIEEAIEEQGYDIIRS